MINMQNFGKIKNAFNGILADGIVSKDKSNNGLFKNYIKMIKESEILSTQFVVYLNLEKKLGTDYNTTNLYVSENLRLLEKYKVSDIIKENNKLMTISKLISEKIDEPYDEKLTSLHEGITSLIFTKRGPKTIDVVVESMSKVIKLINENKAKEVIEVIDLPNSLLSKIMLEKYNEEYSVLNETEREILRVLVESTDDDKKVVYDKLIRECIECVNESLKDSDLVTKEKLLSVKDKLLNDKKEIDEDFINKLSKLIELKSSLNNN
jgi:hypothetical protein